MIWLIMPSIERNLEAWDRSYHWSGHGDEWTDQARFCGKPYGEWKDSIAVHFINPNLGPASTALEVAPGHGRWTGYLAKKAEKLVLADLSPSCIGFCRRRFSGMDNISYHVNDGRSLPFIKEASVDFIWSFDSFVHMEKDVIASYFSEFSRVLRPGGKAIIHHAGRNHPTLGLHAFLKPLGFIGERVYQLLSMGRVNTHDGWRSNVSREMVRELAGDCGLIIEAQVDSWGKDKEYNTGLFKDCITTMRKQR
jgi:ubiquinone/menaquinone biosynthesis C-methylase UbiE